MATGPHVRRVARHHTARDIGMSGVFVEIERPPKPGAAPVLALYALVAARHVVDAE